MGFEQSSPDLADGATYAAGFEAPYDQELLRLTGDPKKNLAEEKINLERGPALTPEEMAAVIMSGPREISIANLHLQAGRLDEAANIFQKVLSANPNDIAAMSGLAEVAYKTGDNETALGLCRKTIRRAPNQAQARLTLGHALKRSGRLDEAAESYRRALGIKPDLAEAAYSLSLTLIESNQPQDAVEVSLSALEANPAQIVSYLFLSDVLVKTSRLPEAEQVIRRALDFKPGEARLFEQLAKILLLDDRLEEALEYLRYAVRLDPRNQTLRDRFRGGISRIVPSWHFRMLNDQPRNDAFEKAILRSARPEDLVLEIGTGSGLLAMMAARSGVKRVVTCEMVETIAAKAARIVAQNGYENQIRVVSKKSSALEVGPDLPHKADLLILEVFSSELLAENILPCIEDAKARLVKPGARIIPARAAICGMLVGGGDLEKSVSVEQVSGFDLRPFNEFTPLKYIVGQRNEDYLPLSDDFEIFDFDFMGRNSFPADQKTLMIPVTSSGKCHGVLQWLSLRLDDETTVQNSPRGKRRSSHWQNILYTFPEPVILEKGQTIILDAEHNRRNLHISIKQILNQPSMEFPV